MDLHEMSYPLTKSIPFTVKTNIINFSCYVGGGLIMCPHCVKHFGGVLDGKLHFHSYV
jgi:hypothetical protein